MPYFIDRRLNPKGKSLANRQRFLRRARTQIREAVQKSLKDSAVADISKERKIKISSKGTREPRFRLDPKTAGERDFVLPGNRDFTPGDEIKKPKSGDGGGHGKDAADYAEGEDDFEFVMSQDEVLDIFFEDLELPNLVRTTLKETPNTVWKRAGITTAGSPTQINLVRTMRNAQGRRLALKRPSLRDIKALEDELDRLEREDPQSEETRAKIVTLKENLARANAKRKWVGFIDPIDVRYNSYTEQPVPTSQAVMFCLMDVSGSMGEREKDLAKRFYMLLHLFLRRRYDRVDIVFIRHTHDAQEVDEQEFFYSRQSGGTIVSTALDKMLEIQRERYTTSDWNIYAAQASDGYTQSGDARRCVEMLNADIMPLCQYYAYIEILDEREMEVFASEDSGAELWRAYRTVAELWPNFATKRISKPADIFPVFRELFKKAESTG
ncbi:MAG: YeaH/YhbH family protein [Alphaproteobacteria bacterium]|nr:YeaH/YhbH family protein [Alphaproteobacteria bacterium]MDE2163340.1 YeaH/YhbH family protein [Alphaproteobacteria bacterium]MDE2500465.1 YeaH/YhbH family protein [Alphaproteobacteria bacterium]